MIFQISCKMCGNKFWVGGEQDNDVNATVLDESDSAWHDEACEHVKAGGEYEITDLEVDEPDCEDA